ncbi:MAG: hypothetical protein QGH66_08980 [Dehalococcoidia bacterium]|nr:hypothetical protein [Dehalococcoidia bacterium]
MKAVVVSMVLEAKIAEVRVGAIPVVMVVRENKERVAFSLSLYSSAPQSKRDKHSK